MRGRATGVVLSALVVLALLAVVAIAATGSTPGGDGTTRPPSETLLDTFFTLGFVAVALGGILLLYGLTQRKAIANEIASGRYGRSSLVAFLASVGLFTAFAYWRYRNWDPSSVGDEENGFLGEAGEPPTTAEADFPAAYEPSISWLPIAVVVGLVLAAVAAYIIAERRARLARPGREHLAAQLAIVLDDTLDDLRAEADARRAIIAAYARLERVLAANGVPRHPAETPDEYVPRVLGDLELDSDAVEQLTALFTRAKFSPHDIDTAMKEDAIAALERVRDELRPGVEAPEPASPASAVGASS